ncbi:MAG: type II secretion system protein [Lentisphaerae bacterium]|nr:type II secretion system protein [Lentisphaerota bacterium]
MRCRHFTLLELAAVIAILILLTAVSSVYIGRERRGPEFRRALQDFQVFCARARSETMQDGKVRKVVFYPEEKVFRIETLDSWGDGSSVMLAEDLEGDDEKPYVVLDAIDPELEEELKSYDEESAEEDSERQDDDSDREKKAPEWRFPEKLEVQFELPEDDGEEDEDLFPTSDSGKLSKFGKAAEEEDSDSGESLELWRYTRGGAARLSHELTLQMNSLIYKLTVSDFTGLIELREPADEDADGEADDSYDGSDTDDGADAE